MFIVRFVLLNRMYATRTAPTKSGKPGQPSQPVGKLDRPQPQSRRPAPTELVTHRSRQVRSRPPGRPQRRVVHHQLESATLREDVGRTGVDQTFAVLIA